jgi:hypothetical protein
MFCEVTVYFPFLLIYFTMCGFHNKQPYSQDALSDGIQMNSAFQTYNLKCDINKAARFELACQMITVRKTESVYIDFANE